MEAAAGGEADSAVQLEALHCLAAALGAPSARAALQQLIQRQPSEQHAVTHYAAAVRCRSGAMPQRPALQSPAVQGIGCAAGGAVVGLQLMQRGRSDAVTWRAPTVFDNTSAADVRLHPAPSSERQPATSLAELLLSATHSECVQPEPCPHGCCLAVGHNRWATCHTCQLATQSVRSATLSEINGHVISGRLLTMCAARWLTCR